MKDNIYNSKRYALLNQEDGYLFKRILEFLDPKKEDKILEIGCGRGILTKKISSFTDNVVGIDANSEAVAGAEIDGLKAMDATALEFPLESFDKVYSCHTIEHVPDLQKFFSEIERVLKPGGRVILVYPWELVRGMGALVASITLYKNPFCARKIHLHKLNPKKIERIAEKFGLKHIESRFLFFRTFQFITVLEKINKLSRSEEQ